VSGTGQNLNPSSPEKKKPYLWETTGGQRDPRGGTISGGTNKNVVRQANYLARKMTALTSTGGDPGSWICGRGGVVKRTKTVSRV